MTVCTICKREPREPHEIYCAACREQLDAEGDAHRGRALDALCADYPRGAFTTFDDLDVDDHNRDAINQARELVEGDLILGDAWDTLYLHGPTGTGKTTIALALAAAYINRHRWDSARFVVVRDLLADARAAMTRGDTDSPIKRVLACPVAGKGNVDLLVLDDVGAERPTEYAVETLAHIVERRYSTGLPLIVTSNYAPSKLAQRLGGDSPIAGQRIVSRLRDNSIVIKLDGPDRRVAPESLRAVA